VEATPQYTVEPAATTTTSSGLGTSGSESDSDSGEFGSYESMYKSTGALDINKAQRESKVGL